jgi:acetyltransferase-like isoleucine patch superfamily enzyme
MSQDLATLARELAPLIAQELVRIPVFYGGGPDQVICGEGVKLNNTLFNLNAGTVHIGAHTFFGHDVSVITGSHDPSKTGIARKKFARDGRDIVIGTGVWIASRALILGPCVIGDNAVVAAGAVLLPGEYAGDCIYAGVPAVAKRQLKS